MTVTSFFRVLGSSHFMKHEVFELSKHVNAMKILYTEFTSGCFERFSETMYGNVYERDHTILVIIRKYSSRQEKIVSI